MKALFTNRFSPVDVMVFYFVIITGQVVFEAEGPFWFKLLFYVCLVTVYTFFSVCLAWLLLSKKDFREFIRDK